jgi:hypothetical protein
MRRIAIPSLREAAIITGLGMVVPSTSRTESVADTQRSNTYMGEGLAAKGTQRVDNLPSSDTLLAQVFYPPVSDRQGLKDIFVTYTIR